MLLGKNIKLYLSVLVYCLAILTSKAQHSNILSYFQATENNGKVTLNWQIIAGSTCSGIQIYRSTDSTNFSQIGEIIGVCGSFSEPVNYTFTDDSPLQNAVNYYRLALGTTGKSITVSIQLIDTKATGYQVRPHPLNSTGYIYFANDISTLHQLSIYNASGLLKLTQTTTSNFFTIESNLYINGIYLFVIENGDKITTKGKFVIVN